MDDRAKVISQLSFNKIFFAVLIICGAWLALSWMRRFFISLGNRYPQMRFLIGQVEPPIRIGLWFFVLFICVEVLAPSREAVLAVLASAAVAIGLGLQDLIKNVVGGLVIVLDRPFQTGDLVSIRRARGEVAKIGLRSTTIRSFDGAFVIVPNADLVNRYVFNSNAGTPECPVSTSISLPPGVDYDFALSVGREIAVACPYTHLGRPISVDVAEGKLIIGAYAYDHRYESAMRTQIFLRANGALKSAGASV